MRLLHTEDLRFEEFFDSQVPEYAVLSHRWGKQEVTFQDFEVAKTQAWPGFMKISDCCSFAKSRGFTWVWIDTCCIDKKSSAELSEAINSMFRLYKEARECYAYLSDVQGGQSSDLKSSFAQSAWWTRGWTLQELLAPSRVIFLDCDWNLIGEKNQLLEEVSAITGIAMLYLHEIHAASVATKMSWISRRKTSRVEDMAYCLLGLFDVHMPLLYGEGRKAFLRLELEILKKSDDESIFAWTSKKRHLGLLAMWPDSFADSANIMHSSNTSLFDEEMSMGRRPYSMTNKGLELTVPQSDLPRVSLNCWERRLDGDFLVMITLQNCGRNWMRVAPGELRFKELKTWYPPSTRPTEKQTIYIPQDGL